MSRTFLGIPGRVKGAGGGFPERAHHALADTQLRRNLRKATTTIRTKRAVAVGELPDWEELREAGRVIKERTLRSLDTHLEQLERAVTERGGHVHWARDAAEACDIVAGLVKAKGATEVVKVKSLATDEIKLNEALAENGISAYETDLAELIVQLGHDTQSHILVPAIHKNRSEIRDIFRREMPGVAADLGDDPVELAMAARKYLRKKFLSAKVGISGANFAVAETGSLVVVESEGNGRMCLTLPETLISVVGIEKVIPSWVDLEVFLQLLPRSSTAERMNPYTSIWSGVTPGDGPQEFHLVLLDNGRTNVLSDEVNRQALACIRCSACLNVCPVYERTGGQSYGSVYPGPIGAILTPAMVGVEHAPTLPYASSLCGACYDVCPVKINIPEVLVHLRSAVVEEKREHRVPRPEAVAMKAMAWVFDSPKRWERAQRAARRGSGVLAKERDNWPGSRTHARLDRFPRCAGNTGRIVPGLVASPMSAREEILGRVRSALQDAPAPEDVQRAYRRDSGLDHEGVLELFVETVADYKATVRRVSSADRSVAVAEILTGRGLQRVAAPADFPAGLIPASIETVSDSGQLTSAELDAVDGAITQAAVGIANTGTLILDAGAGQGRRLLSLVPDYHLCIIDAERVVGSVPEAIRRLDAARPITLISGPSATSDIELNRVEGVHGPRTLDVLLVD